MSKTILQAMILAPNYRVKYHYRQPINPQCWGIGLPYALQISRSQILWILKVLNEEPANKTA
jgi:hypothetical protein